jgi:hypothetical protein
MQFEDEDDFAVERIKQVCFYLSLPLILVLIIVCYVASIPLYMLASLFYKPLDWSNHASSFAEGQFVDCLCFCLPDLLRLCLLWILFLPRAILYMITFAPLKITVIFWGGLCRAF